MLDMSPTETLPDAADTIADLTPSDPFLSVWYAHATALPMLAGAIRRAGVVDVQEVYATLQDTRTARGPVYAGKVKRAWLVWYPRYVADAIQRVVAASGNPDAKRRVADKALKARARMVDAACDLLHLIERRNVVPLRNLRRIAGGLTQARIDATIALLQRIGAVRITAAGVVATGCPDHVRRWLMDARADLFEVTEKLENC